MSIERRDSCARGNRCMNRLEQERPCLGDSTADDDGVGADEDEHVCERKPDHLAGSFERSTRAGVAAACAINGLLEGCRARCSRDRTGAPVQLEATAVSVGARQPVFDDCVVTELSRGRTRRGEAGRGASGRRRCPSRTRPP